MRYIELTRGYVAIVDDCDYEAIAKYKWRAFPNKNTCYAARSVYLSEGLCRDIFMHRQLMNAPKGMQVDHRDGNGLNNTSYNLRLATHQQNQRNKRLQRNNTSGFKGVSWYKKESLWVANISVNGRTITLGRFPTAEAAHAAYCEASAKYHGPFGRTG